MKPLGLALLPLVFSLAACIPDAAPDGGSEPAAGETVPVIDGRYDLDAEKCSDPNSPSRMTVHGDGFEFYDASCTFGRKGGQSGASEGVMICLGESRRFTRALRLESRSDTLIIHENNRQRVYARCPATGG